MCESVCHASLRTDHLSRCPECWENQGSALPWMDSWLHPSDGWILAANMLSICYKWTMDYLGLWCATGWKLWEIILHVSHKFIWHLYQLMKHNWFGWYYTNFIAQQIYHYSTPEICMSQISWLSHLILSYMYICCQEKVLWLGKMWVWVNFCEWIKRQTFVKHPDDPVKHQPKPKGLKVSFEFTDIHFNDLFGSYSSAHCYTIQDSPRMMDSLALTVISPSVFSATHS